MALAAPESVEAVQTALTNGGATIATAEMQPQIVQQLAAAQRGGETACRQGWRKDWLTRVRAPPWSRPARRRATGRDIAVDVLFPSRVQRARGDRSWFLRQALGSQRLDQLGVGLPPAGGEHPTIPGKITSASLTRAATSGRGCAHVWAARLAVTTCAAPSARTRSATNARVSPVSAISSTTATRFPATSEETSTFHTGWSNTTWSFTRRVTRTG